MFKNVKEEDVGDNIVYNIVRAFPDRGRNRKLNYEEKIRLMTENL